MEILDFFWLYLLIGSLSIVPPFMDEQGTFPFGGEVASLPGTLELVLGSGAVNLQMLSKVRFLSETFPTYTAPKSTICVKHS